MNKFGEDALNQDQLQRFREILSGKIEPNQGDLNLYTHELRESLRYKKLGFSDAVPEDSDLATKVWNNTHTATLEDYGVQDIDLYDPGLRKIHGLD